ncbi:MAG: beta-ketoacyl-[acyl-carrier-protein] synthase family protein [Thermodesulfobacteriota bacterium]|nr:beta-ketoacyl-[acyl-carrier-protein] synthase family protein [Thermodesulfobacteriota bacterium]
MRRRVVITGMGVVCPNGNNMTEFEDALRNGRSGVRFVQRLADLNFGCRIAGIPRDTDTVFEKHINKKQLKDTSENIGYASVAALEAWTNAGFSVDRNREETDWDTGAVMGCGIGDMDTIAERIVPLVNEGRVRRIGSRVIEQVMSSGVSARVGGLLGLGNQVTSNSSACNTGSEAVIDAMYRIRDGRARRMIAGGAEAPSPYTWGGFDSMRILSRKFNDAPEKGSRPMSASACGFVPGAGAGVLVLEELETALARGADIYAEILGGYVNSGGQRGGGSMTAPNADGVLRCIRQAISDAGISPDEIDAINGHLSATFADPHEIQNWSNALERGPSDFPYINSTKSLIGHCLGAAGAIETVAAVIQLHKGFLHPSINCEDIHPEIMPFSDKIVQTRKDYPDIKVLAKASFGFGDVNGCLILKKWEGGTACNQTNNKGDKK